MSLTSTAFVRMIPLLLAAALAAQAAANYTGEWKLNTGRSNFGPMPAPDKQTLKVAHKEPSLEVILDSAGAQGEFRTEFKYTTDGKECENDFRGIPIKSMLKWEGDVLQISSKGNFGGSDVTFVDKWKLSEDGKLLTVDRRLSGAQGDLDQVMFYEKQ